MTAVEKAPEDLTSEVDPKVRTPSEKRKIKTAKKKLRASRLPTTPSPETKISDAVEERPIKRKKSVVAKRKTVLHEEDAPEAVSDKVSKKSVTSKRKVMRSKSVGQKSAASGAEMESNRNTEMETALRRTIVIGESEVAPKKTRKSVRRRTVSRAASRSDKQTIPSEESDTIPSEENDITPKTTTPKTSTPKTTTPKTSTCTMPPEPPTEAPCLGATNKKQRGPVKRK